MDSRRKCEQIIRDGRVTINGQTATVGVSIDPETDDVRLDGAAPSSIRPTAVYILNKPRGVITTAADTHGRPTVLDLVDVGSRVFPVGRLDMDSEGLVLLTNDGELANLLIHPSHHMPRIYEVTVRGKLSMGNIKKLVQGVDIGDRRPAKAIDVQFISASKISSTVRIELGEGRKRQIRRMMTAIGFKVTKLVRTQFGPILLGHLKEGKFRKLKKSEIDTLRRSVQDSK